MNSRKKSPTKTHQTPDPHLNQLMEELLTLQQIEKDRNAFSQRVGKTGTFTWDLKSDTANWTREFEALYGYPNGGYPGGDYSKWHKFIHPDDRAMVEKVTKLAIKNNNELNLEFRVIWPDKSIHYLLTRARIIRNLKGKPIEISGVNIDISERKQTEKNLEYLAKTSKILASSLDYRETLRMVAKVSVPEIADWCSVDMVVNNEIKRLAVVHKDPKKVKWAWELSKKYPAKLTDPTGAAEIIRTGKNQFYPVITEEMILATVKTPEELEIFRKAKIHSIMMVPLTVEHVTIGIISFVSSDPNRTYTLSDLTIAEEVASRAALAIHNARLFTDSQSAISIRDEFISVASHELKTPVTSMKMYTQILLRQLEKRNDQTLIAPLTKMNVQIEKLTGLISDLLNISRIELGILEFHEELFSLDELIKEIVDSIQPSSDDHMILIQGSVKKNVWGDKDRISQVITNLLTNAIKYSPNADTVKVVIKENNDDVRVTVKDSGIGISKEQQNKIFNRFYRVTGAEEKTFPGLGIGLFISTEIMRRHGSTIEVKSSKGKGSEFSFRLYFKKQEK